jgi:DNA-directed RNA polymerase subunit H
MSHSFAHSGTTQVIYNSRKTLLSYLQSQGYSIEDYDEFSINEVLAMISNNQLDMLINEDTTNEEKRKVYVKYHLKKSLRPQYIDEFVEDLYNLENVLQKNDTLIVVSKDEPNDSLKKYLKQIYADDNVFVVILSLKRLQFNVLDHELVPKHRILDDGEHQVFLKKYNIRLPSQIPEISRFDPVALCIGLRPGSIVHITRPSKTAIKGDYYRYCINA